MCFSRLHMFYEHYLLKVMFYPWCIWKKIFFWNITVNMIVKFPNIFPSFTFVVPKLCLGISNFLCVFYFSACEYLYCHILYLQFCWYYVSTGGRYQLTYATTEYAWQQQSCMGIFFRTFIESMYIGSV